jgi:hypothetical protein
VPIDEATFADDAKRKSCGYSLRKITARRCPQCRREFDPADPRTVHHGQPAIRADFVRQRIQQYLSDPDQSVAH